MSQRTCVTEDCGRPHYGRGWCKYHYQQAWLGGRIDERPRELVPAGSSLDERLRHHGWDVTPSGCWEWRGGLNGHGYGQLAVGKDRPYIASRAAYMAWVGPIPDGEVICHRCDNPPCINPAHLYAGTHVDNARDAWERKRTANGERHGQHRLTDAEVAEIRTRHAAGGIKHVDLAVHYGVSRSLISAILLGKRRAHATFGGKP